MEEDRKEEVKETPEVEQEEKVEEVTPEVEKEDGVNEEKKEEIEDTQVIRKQEPPKKKKTGVRVVVIILILILICVLGYAAYLNFKPKKVVKAEKQEYKSELRLSGNGLEDFDLYFMKLENNKKNSVYSPLSIKYALAMLSEGAKGETKEQIDSIIGDYKAKTYPNNEHMSFANAMFIRDSFKDNVNEGYIKNLKDKYGAEVVIDPFANPDNINSWVSNRTFNLINNLVDDVSNNDFFLINALAIDMNWNYQIHCALGQTTPCLGGEYGDYHITYNHEKIKEDDKFAYSWTEVPYSGDNAFYHLEFNGQKDTKASKVLADFNKYDIVKDLGEDKIRKEVGDAYRKYLDSEQGKNDLKSNPEYVITDVDKFLDGYIDELNSNYGKGASNTDFYLYDDKEVKVFAKDLKEYDGMTLQYVGIMPVEEELSSYIDNVKADDINNIIRGLKEVKIDSFKEGVATIVRGDIPLFKYDYQLQLVEDLNKLGIKNIFDSNSDLSNMVKGKATIDKAIHKADIDFSNEGIKAAAATAIGGFGATSGGFEYLYLIPTEEIDLTFNKPYMYIIRDKDSGEVWFTGTVYEPSKK